MSQIRADQISSGNEFEQQSRTVTVRTVTVRSDDQSSLLRVAVRVSCTHRLLIALAVFLGFIVGRVTGSDSSQIRI
eukprot:248140-Amphidinium_carterae.1